MLHSFARLEKNLGRAGTLLALALLCGAAAALALQQWNADVGPAVLLAWSFMPFVAWFMAKAARAQDRKPLRYGLVSLLPPLAILAFASLLVRDAELRFGRSKSSSDSA